METDKYIRIASIKELEAARKDLDARMEEKEKEIEARYLAIKEFYTPDNIIRGAIRSTTSTVNWVPFALTLIRSLKRRLE